MQKLRHIQISWIQLLSTCVTWNQTTLKAIFRIRSHIEIGIHHSKLWNHKWNNKIILIKIINFFYVILRYIFQLLVVTYFEYYFVMQVLCFIFIYHILNNIINACVLIIQNFVYVSQSMLFFQFFFHSW